MSTAIAAWLKHQGPYSAGLALLQAEGTADEDTLEFLALGETSVTRSQLTKLLKGALEEGIQRTKQATANEGDRTFTPRLITVEDDRKALRTPRTDGYAGKELSAVQRVVHDAIKSAWKEMDYLRHRLELLPSDDDRRRDALRIVELDDEIVSSYARLDAWLANGRDPAEEVRIPQATSLDLLREIRNIKTYLSRHKSGARKLTEEKAAHYAARAEEIQKAINALQ